MQMKASEVLKRYAEGRRDFRGESLRGQSFKGKDLKGADFSEADIRGADFTNANLRGTKFSFAKAGLQKRWAIVLVIVAWLFSGISGIFVGFVGLFVAYIFYIFDSSSTGNQIVGWVVLVVLIVKFLQYGNSRLSGDQTIQKQAFSREGHNADRARL